MLFGLNKNTKHRTIDQHLTTKFMKKVFALSLITLSFLAGCAADRPTTENYESGLGTTSDQHTTLNTTAMNDTSDKTSLQLAPPAAGDKVATIETDLGTIKIRLFDQQVPEMTKNFEELANSGKYNGTPFHRVVKDFMIQTGDFTNKNGTGGYSYKGQGTMLDDEIVPDLKHLYGTVSMANRGPNTNGSQFFIVTNENGTSFLNGGYTIFGQVYEGMEVAKQIESLQVPGTEEPSETVTMNKVTVEPYQPE